MRIVADDKIPFLKGALEPYADVLYVPGKQINRTMLLDADALLIRTRTICNRDLLDGTKIKFIGTATIGFDHIDTHYCNKKGIFWTNAPGCNSSSVFQYIAAALSEISERYNFRLSEKVLGIIGVGNVGSKIEKFARLLGMKILLNDPPRERSEGSGNYHDLTEILSQSDIITLHVPLNLTDDDNTFHLIDEDKFNKVKPGTLFINSSRGEVTDTGALKNAINSGRLGAAIIDVWENEPDIDRELLHLASIATPHIAGYSTDGKANGTAMIVNSALNFFNLSPDVWYPENVPVPEKPNILLECSDKNENEIIGMAIAHSYNINEDDKNLRTAPDDFEKLRGDYPLRREFSSYTVTLKNGSENIRQLLEAIGFKVKT